MSKLSTTLEGLRDQPDDDLRQALARTRDELFRLHLGQHTNQVTSTAALTTKRREIAQIMTILRGRQLGFETQAQKKAADAAPATEAAPTKKTKKAKS
jgi:large subunit ribosomal protein L29